MTPKSALTLMAAATCVGILIPHSNLALHAQQPPMKEPPTTNTAKARSPNVLGDGPWDFETQTGKLHVTVVAKNLNHPWSMTWLPNGDILVTERPGRLRLIHNGVLDPTPIAGLPRIRPGILGGLMDVVLHPNYAQNHRVYFTYATDGWPEAARSPLAIGYGIYDGGHQLRDFQQIFLSDPYGGQSVPAGCCGQGPGDASYGSRLVFLRDGTILFTSGDRNHGEYSRDPASNIGKTIRLNDDGSIPQNNPWVGTRGYRPELYTMGHRNPLGLTIHPVTGEIWSTEFGPTGGDELNKIVAGKDYGYIQVTKGRHYGQNGTEKLQQGPDAKADGIEEPVRYWIPSINPCNIAFYEGRLFPTWKDNLLMATLTFSLVRMTLDASGHVASEERMLDSLGQRLRDVRVAPDGSVYLLTDENAGAMLKIEPAR